MSKIRPAVVWFRSDLRIQDHQPLLEAMKRGNGHVIPVYCFDPRQIGPLAKTRCGQFPKTGIHRTRFLIQSIHNLRQNLKRIGSNLVVRVGHPETVIPEIVRDASAIEVFAHKEVCSEEVIVENRLRKALQVPLQLQWGGVTLVHLDDLPFNENCKDLPNVFTQFRKRVESEIDFREPLPAPSQLQALPDDLDLGLIPNEAELCPSQGHLKIDSRSVLNFEGGEDAAFTRLEEYLWKSDLLATYKETRNGLIGASYSSKFSAWLAHGNISARTIYYEVKRYEQLRVKNESTYWLIFELLWRDYFRFVCLQHGTAIFHPGGIQDKSIAWKHNPGHLQAWIHGQTGLPFVDANMRELLASGFMSNRGRQNVASFLTKDLLLDWRLGAEWFESMLIDHDVCSNYGNWNYAAGIGNDPRQGRHFNVIRQAKTYDEDGEYVKLWCPELKDLPCHMVHTPFSTLPNLQEYNFVLGENYPHPIISSLDQGRIPLKGSKAAFVKGKKFDGPGWMKKQHGHKDSQSARAKQQGRKSRKGRVQSGWT